MCFLPYSLESLFPMKRAGRIKLIKQPSGIAMLPNDVANALYKNMTRVIITSLSPNHAEATLEVGLIKKGYPNAAMQDPITTQMNYVSCMETPYLTQLPTKDRAAPITT